MYKEAIAGVHAIRSVEFTTRVTRIDPLIQVVAPRDRPDLIDDAYKETYPDTFLAWNILYGKEHPELSRSPEILDTVGANNYLFEK